MRPKGHMRLEEIDNSWAVIFAREADRIRSGLGSLVVQVEHVGSTAVPGILGKPILDIGMLVRGVDDFEAISPLLQDLGYRDRGQNGPDVLRRYFSLDKAGERVVQLHVWTTDAPAWDETMAFRDLLRCRADLRKAYGEEKLRAAKATGWMKNAYSLEKAAFVERVLEIEGIRAVAEIATRID